MPGQAFLERELVEKFLEKYTSVWSIAANLHKETRYIRKIANYLNLECIFTALTRRNISPTPSFILSDDLSTVERISSQHPLFAKPNSDLKTSLAKIIPLPPEMQSQVMDLVEIVNHLESTKDEVRFLIHSNLLTPCYSGQNGKLQVPISAVLMCRENLLLSRELKLLMGSRKSQASTQLAQLKIFPIETTNTTPNFFSIYYRKDFTPEVIALLNPATQTTKTFRTRINSPKACHCAESTKSTQLNYEK